MNEKEVPVGGFVAMTHDAHDALLFLSLKTGRVLWSHMGKCVMCVSASQSDWHYEPMRTAVNFRAIRTGAGARVRPNVPASRQTDEHERLRISTAIRTGAPARARGWPLTDDDAGRKFWNCLRRTVHADSQLWPCAQRSATIHAVLPHRHSRFGCSRVGFY